MTVHRTHTFALADADLTGSSLTTASAGGGLNGRITGAFDFGAAVLALAPSGYWRMGESGGSFEDGTANNRDLTLSGTTGVTRGVSGHGRGGDTGAGLQTTGTGEAVAGGEYAEHRFTAGTPWAVLVHGKRNTDTLSGYAFANTRNSPSASGNTAGWAICANSLGTVLLYIGNGSTNCSLRITDESAAGAGWRSIAFIYNGGATNSAASWTAVVDGVTVTTSASGADLAAGGAITSAAALQVGQQSTSSIVTQDVAIWSAVTPPTPEQIAALQNIALGKMRWTLAFPAAATIRGTTVPGGITRTNNGSATSKDIALYLSTDGVNRTAVTLGEDPAYAVTAGQTLYLDVELTHLAGEHLPFVGDSTGLFGPTIFYEEAEAAVTVNVTGITTSASGIDIETNYNFGTVAAPTNGAAPALYVTSATAVGDTLTIVANEQAGGGAPTLPDGGWAMGGTASSPDTGGGGGDPWTMRGTP